MMLVLKAIVASFSSPYPLFETRATDLYVILIKKKPRKDTQELNDYVSPRIIFTVYQS